MLKKIFKIFYGIICIISFSTIIIIAFMANNIDSDYKIIKGNNLVVSTSLPITAEYDGKKLDNSNINNKIGEKFDVKIKLFGIIPITKTNVEVVDEMYCAVLGSPFGVKIYTNGVLVVDVKDVVTENGNVCPGKDCGIKIGDSIISINGERVTSNEDVAEIIENSNGNELKVEIKRNNQTKTLKLKPVYSAESGSYKAGIWVRDSSAGIGMLTFYSPSTNTVCGLGHGISDEDTGNIIDFCEGELVSASVISYKKGVPGTPGELKGKFGSETIGELLKNCNMGIYGLAECNIDLKNLTKIALKQEIYDGNATILSTIDGDTPKEYSCTVKLKGGMFDSNTRNFIVKITDEELLNTTGGIIQGMSGSPILQNGRLIGAITHVLVDDPTTGYAIFAETMLETAQDVANENKLKDAS